MDAASAIGGSLEMAGFWSGDGSSGVSTGFSCSTGAGAVSVRFCAAGMDAASAIGGSLEIAGFWSGDGSAGVSTGFSCSTGAGAVSVELCAAGFSGSPS